MADCGLFNVSAARRFWSSSSVLQVGVVTFEAIDLEGRTDRAARGRGCWPATPRFARAAPGRADSRCAGSWIEPAAAVARGVFRQSTPAHEQLVAMPDLATIMQIDGDRQNDLAPSGIADKCRLEPEDYLWKMKAPECGSILDN